MSLNMALTFLDSHDDYLILTHTRPDGDTLGSAAALCRALRAIGKRAAVLPNPEASAGYLPYLEGLWASEGDAYKTILSVDLASADMFPENAKCYINAVDLAIDHHVNGARFGKLRYVDPTCAACGELIFDIAQALNCLTPEVALPLYVALATDTACFADRNTTAETHQVAGALIGTGIDFYGVNKRHFHTKTKRRIAMEAELLGGVEYFDGGRGVFVTITREMIERLSLDEDDLDNVSRLGAQIEGVDCSVTLREQPSGDWKASVRTGPRVNAEALCARFGGGGHSESAGCILCGLTSDEAKRAIRNAVEA